MDVAVLVSPSERVYLAAMAGLALAGAIVAARRRSALAVTQREYRAQLLDPLRLGTFALALATFVLAAPYTGDPTWDAIDAAFMSIGCYLFAPWTLATVFRVATRRASLVELALALIATWMVVSAGYDGYLVLRDGVYPVTSASNAAASAVLYTLGGLFFSLGLDETRGIVFVFMDARWPRWHGDRWTLRRALGLPILALAIAAPIVVYVVWVVMDQLGALP